MSPGHLHIQHVILLREASVMRVILGNTSGTFADVNPETRRPDRPVPPMGGTGRSGRLCICWSPPKLRNSPAQAAGLVVPGYRLGV